MSATAPQTSVLRVDGSGDGLDPPSSPLLPARTGVTLAETEVVRVDDGATWFVEGRRARAGRATDAYLSTGALGPDGTSCRLVTLRCAAVPYEPRALAAASSSATEPGAVKVIMNTYFDALADDDLEAAAACFAEGCLYSHPPYRAGQRRHTFLGRGGLLAGWRAHRGEIAGRPEILVCAQAGALAFVEGVAGGGTFLSSVLLDPDGRIKRYVALFRRPVVPLLQP